LTVLFARARKLATDAGGGRWGGASGFTHVHVMRWSLKMGIVCRAKILNDLNCSTETLHNTHKNKLTIMRKRFIAAS